MEVLGSSIDLCSFTRESWHAFWKVYIADPKMDPNTYVYNKEKVDESFDRSLERDSWYPSYGVFLKNGNPIGLTNLKRIDYEKSRCELGIILVNDSVKGKGYGTKAVSLLVNYAFNGLGLKTIYADTMGTNYRMQHVLGKMGFQLLERIERYYDMHDRWEDKLNYILVRG
ncbi:MAG TPA: hypothetical protein DCL69_07205 [Firmicutes bacterium]|mgnify:FL=1|nr:hypothetical protein [Bacillota bacterium]